MFQWRRFQYFEKEQLQEDDGKGKKIPLKLFQDFEPSCSTSGRGHLIFGDAKGTIIVLNRDLQKQEFKAYEGEVIDVVQLKRTNTLITIGNESSNTCVKIWKLDQLDGDGKPACARTISIFSSKFPQVPVTSFAILEELTQMALGLGNGAVMLFEGNLLRDRSCKQKLLQRSGPCVTGVHFREADNGKITLFVVTNNEVISFFTDLAPRLCVDSEGGCELKCSTMTEDKKLVCARKEAVYFYEPEERGVCFGFEGNKKMVSWFNSYLILVEESKDLKKNTLTIYDLRNKFIAFAAKFDPIVNITSEWGSIFVLTSTKQCFQLQEKDLPAKMDMLFRKNLFAIAISLAKTQDVEKSYVMDIFRMYGDHLYDKGDYDGSMNQYLETIKFVEPSYVIRKFLDAQRIHNLTRYLQALHEKHRANTDHTTLLLNCYTKLKDESRLDQFVKSDSGLSFDVKTAIRVCRQAAYFEHALYLAHKHGEHELYLKIQLEDESNYVDALKYISSLSFADAERYIKEYGQKFIDHLPKEATQILKALCTSYKPTPFDIKETKFYRSQLLASSPTSSSSSSSSSSTSSVTSPSSTVSITDFKELESDTRPSKQKAKADEYIHFFVGQPAYLQELLEDVHHEKCSPIVYNTLLELYLRQDFDRNEPLEKERKYSKTHPRHHKIMNLLKSQAPYDQDHALVLTKMYNFERGILYLYGKLKLYHEIVQHHMENNQHSKIIKACKKYGDQDTNLWVQALSYFAAKEEPCEEEIVQVLENIDRNHLLPPLMVVQILSQNPSKPLSVVKDYIIRILMHEQEIIHADQNEIWRYQDGTASMRKEIEELRTRATTFQGLKCHMCNSALSLPAVHFLCMHSFHQRCIVESDKECPMCAPEFRKVKEIKDQMRASVSQHDKFFKQLDDSPDGFATVAEYFGRGIFDSVPKKGGKGDTGTKGDEA